MAITMLITCFFIIKFSIILIFEILIRAAEINIELIGKTGIKCLGQSWPLIALLAIDIPIKYKIENKAK